MSSVRFEGRYLDGQSTDVRILNFCWDGQKLWSEDDREHIHADVCTLDSPLGNTLRIFRLPDGAVVQTSNLEVVRSLEQNLNLNRWMLKVHRMEQHWPWVFLALMMTCLAFWLGYRHLLPVLAHAAAKVTPMTIKQALDSKSLELLERRNYAASRIPTKTQNRLQMQFQKLTSMMDPAHKYQLKFFAIGLQPNAFALPGGTIVVTDLLVKSARNDHEILAVLAHEVGHIQHQHGLRMVYQNMGVSVMLAYALGDVSSLTNVATTLPATLMNTGYSRSFEQEADQVAGEYLISAGWGTQPLQDILGRIAHDAEGSLLSSHPGTNERIAFLKNLESSNAKQIFKEQTPQNGAK